MKKIFIATTLLITTLSAQSSNINETIIYKESQILKLKEQIDIKAKELNDKFQLLVNPKTNKMEVQNQIEVINDEIKSIKIGIVELEEEIKQINSTKVSQEITNNSNIDEFKGKMRVRLDLINKAKTNMDKLNKIIIKKDEEIKKLNDNITEYSLDKILNQQEIQSLQKQIDLLNEKIKLQENEKQQQFEILTAKIDKLQKEITKQNNQIDKLNEVLIQRKGELKVLIDLKIKSQYQIDDLKRQNKILRKELLQSSKQIVEDKVKSKNEIMKLKSKNENISYELSKIKSKLLLSIENEKSLSTLKSKQESKLEMLATEMYKLNEENEKLKKQLEEKNIVLKRQSNELKKYQDRVTEKVILIENQERISKKVEQESKKVYEEKLNKIKSIAKTTYDLVNDLRIQVQEKEIIIKQKDANIRSLRKVIEDQNYLNQIQNIQINKKD